MRADFTEESLEDVNSLVCRCVLCVYCFIQMNICVTAAYLSHTHVRDNDGLGSNCSSQIIYA